jgi:hypothetical protein
MMLLNLNCPTAPPSQISGYATGESPLQARGNRRTQSHCLLFGPALSNPFATRHMWRMAVLMWRMTLFLNTSKTEYFLKKIKIGISNSNHTFLSKTTEMGGGMAQDISFL